MAEYFVAKSYENYERVGEPFEKSGRMYTKAKCKCDRCTHGVYAIGVHNGELVPHPAYGGVCLKCNGTGFIEKTIRLYTAKEYAVVEKAAERRAKEREETRAQEAIERAARAEQLKQEWFAKNGFNSDGQTYCVFGDDTYAIKDHLKELGCKFSPLFMWHSPEPLDVPVGYGMFGVMYDDYMTWDAESGNMIFKEDAKEKIERCFDETKEPSLSEYVGEVGERLRNLTVVFSSRRGFNGKFGWTNIFTFKCGDNVFTWFTSSEPEIEVGNTYDMTATVKKHEEFRSVKTTVVSRCILRAID